MAKYWVGGSAGWDSSKNSASRWSYYSGGPGGYGQPSSGEDAIFDANSGNVTVQVASTRTCYNLDCSAFPGTLTGAAGSAIQVYGTYITFGSSCNFETNRYPTLYIYNNITLTTNGMTVGDIYNNSSLTLADDLVTHNNAYLQNYGTFNANGYNVSIGKLYSGGGSTYLGTGTWNVMQAGPLNAPETAWNWAGGTLYPSSSTLRFNRALDASGLASSMNDSQTTITLREGDKFPSSGVVEIDREQISYTGKSFVSGWSYQLTGCTRGINNTWPASHSAGRAVLYLGVPSTTLTSSAGSGDGTLYVSDNSKFQTNGYLLIDGEIIYYSGKSGSTAFTGCSRGQYVGQFTSSGAASHASGATVRQAEGRYQYLYSQSYNIVEEDTNNSYMYSYIYGSPSITTFQGNPLPANPYPFQWIAINQGGTASITNFNFDGQRGTQGLESYPVQVYGRGAGANTSTRLYLSSYGYPVLPYTYTGGDPWDFFNDW